MNFDDLLNRAEKAGILTSAEGSDFDGFRLLRNAYAHFREPVHEFSGLRRSIRHDQPFDELLRQDAKKALSLLGRYFGRSPFPAVRLY